ncbi:MAG: HK97 family phage prohead protease [Pseudomonadota bacterium]
MYTFRSIPILELKFDSDELAEGEFTGIASAFRDRPDRTGDIVKPGAFKRTLSKHSLEKTTPAMLWSHDQSKPVGAWKDFRETRRGLEVTGRLTLDIPEAKSAQSLMREGALGLSIGYKVAPGGAEVREDGVRLLKDLDLFEVSLVAVPADTEAKIIAVKGVDLDNPREFEHAARDALGLSSRQAKRLMADGYKGLVREERGDSSEELAAIAARLQRITKTMTR